MGWSTTKISRAESGRESLPPAEIEKLVDFYNVADPLRVRLLELAEDATQRGWWDEYAEALTPEYQEFIGLEAEATSCLQYQSDVVPGLLQTKEYAWQLDGAFGRVFPTIPPALHERFLQVRAMRQERLTGDPALRLSVIIDEAVLLRGIGDAGFMHAQLAKLAEAAELPNVELRVLPLKANTGLVAASFAILRFGSRETPDTASLGDVVSTESLNTVLYVEGEAATHFYRLFFDALAQAALPPAESQRYIISTMERQWS